MEDGDGEQALSTDVDLKEDFNQTSEKVTKALIPTSEIDASPAPCVLPLPTPCALPLPTPCALPLPTPCALPLPAVEEDNLSGGTTELETSSHLLQIEVPQIKVNGDVGNSEKSEENDLAVADDVECAEAEDDQSRPTAGVSETEPNDPPPKSRKRKLSDSLVINDSKDDGCSSDGNVEVFKGFKKRILAQTSVMEKSEKTSLQESQLFLSLTKTNTTDAKSRTEGETTLVLPKSDEEPSTPQAEYAQYLGLQPTVKFKCYKCGETGFPSMLKLQEHQNTCLTNLNIQALPKPTFPHVTTDPSPSTNFRITRKVYLCSSCGTYYENWNLFLHMRQVHKRHICLFCLAMFSQAEKLATHLLTKHNIVETNYDSPQHLFKECNGSCFLMCISCECVFSERDNFVSHTCKEIDLSGTDKQCSLCHLRGCHLPTCRLALTNSNSPALPTSSSQRNQLGNASESAQNSANVSVRKYLLPISSIQPINNKKKLCIAEDEVSDIDDDYDICNAASFCHVNIHEQPEKQRPVVISKLKVNAKVRPVDIPSATENEPQLVSSNDHVLSSGDKTPSTLNEESEEEVSKTTREGEAETDSNITSMELNEEPTCNDLTIRDDQIIPDRTRSPQKDSSPETLGIIPSIVNDDCVDDQSSSAALLPPVSDDNIVSKSPSKAESTSTEPVSKSELNDGETNSETEDDEPTLKVETKSNESLLRSVLEMNKTASIIEDIVGLASNRPLTDLVSEPHSSRNDLTKTPSQPEIDVSNSPLTRETHAIASQDTIESNRLPEPPPTINTAVLEETSKSPSRIDNEGSPTSLENTNLNETGPALRVHDNAKETSPPLSEAESTDMVIAVDANASVPKYTKKSKRRRAGLTMKISRSKAKVTAQKDVGGNPKTPITVKFKLIKTSSESSANYTTAAVDGNHIDSEPSDSDKATKDTTSSSESFSNIKMRKRSRKGGGKSSKGNRKMYDVGDRVQENKLEEVNIFENIQVAGEEVLATEIHLEERLETVTIQVLLQESVKSACLSCVFCNHAKKIAVNGKQLALHLLAEHRFIAIYKNDSSSIKNHLSVIDEPINKENKIYSNGEEGDREPTTEELENSRLKNNELISDFVARLKSSLPLLQELFLNTDTYDSSDRSFVHPYDRTYECFHCHFLTTLHKELYVHNRKMHQKTILLCIMCKSNFYSYSELLCHLCPGIYVPDNEIKFRCCVCLVDSLPSAFRLMVHLRKRHHTCDVCLESTSDQQKLSNHVWKHKLHHLCYRCGIAYRNKPDITKHLFWKHGTESVLCKKCLQKKWPHVYHFCVPPNAFICEECNSSFSRAVALKVHKRLHAGDLPYGCEECEERFVAKKLLARHQESHREVPADEEADVNVEDTKPSAAEPEREAPDVDVVRETSATEGKSAEQADALHAVADKSSQQEESSSNNAETATTELPNKKESRKHSHKKQKPKIVDVYDLPPLNLSSDSDDSGDDKVKPPGPSDVQLPATVDDTLPETAKKVETVGVVHAEEEPVATVDGVWDNFQNYKANLERRESQSNESINSSLPFPLNTMTSTEVLSIIMSDHDYFVTSEVKKEEETELTDKSLAGKSSTSVPEQENVIAGGEQKSEAGKSDHDYCSNNTQTGVDTQEEKHQVNNESKISQVDTTGTSTGNESPSKKKNKSVKKRREHTSSSSSDSSSNSGSSSCSCGTNCSCSSSSSMSSGSTSDSSESDSSSSEGRRKQIARREKRRERGKKKKDETNITTSTTPTNGPVEPEEEQQPPVPTVPEAEVEVPIHESDLDTDETETDEDFYDQHPQLLANKLLAEKRNQLLLLAAVAPVSISTQAESSPPPSPPHVSTKKKVKSKKRKKRQHETERKSESKPKVNISVGGYYMNQISNPETFQRSASQVHTPSSQPPPPTLPQVSAVQTASDTMATPSASYSAESGSETDSKRLSKRRRLPKKFYGDSSDEEGGPPPPPPHTLKWPRNIPATSSTPIPSLPPTPPAPTPEPPPARVPPIIIVPAPEVPDKSEEEDEDDAAESESEQEAKKSSSDSSSNSEVEKDADTGSESEAPPPPPPVVPPLIVHAPPPVAGHKKNENLYCYCQCPYDEVSEMIACDGKDCVIEWFHFECVGIMVPPKGKWYCPDCRKRATFKP